VGEPARVPRSWSTGWPRPRLGLRGRFIAFVSAVVIAFGAVLTAFAVKVQNERLRHELEERSKLLTVVAAANATDAMALLEIGELRQLFLEIRQQENVVDVVAFDEDGRILTDGTLKNPRRHQLVAEGVRRHTASSDALLLEFRGAVVEVTKPVILGARRLGGVTLSYSLTGLAEDQSAFTRRTMLVGAVFASLSLLATALLAAAVTRPLREVTAATRALSRGEPAPPLPVRTTDEVGELAAAFNEMTARLRATTVSRDELDLILDTMGECLVVTGVDGTIRRVNKAACELAGVAEEALVGSNCRRLFRAPAGSQSLLHAATADAMAHGLETALQTAAGEAVPVLVSVAPLAAPGEQPRGYVIVAADLSERLRVERQKDEFVTMVHHEVRAPLTAVRGAIGLLSGGVAGQLPDSAKELVAIAQRNAERMERLVADILTARKLDAGRMDFQFLEVEPMALVRQAAEACAAYAGKYGVHIVTEGDLGETRVRVDPDRLIQVLNNVLANAVRFSPPGGTVNLHSSRTGSTVRIAVTDAGPGIPESFRDRVFEKFARADDGSWRHRSGTGLGMSISKAIMEELGGAISFESAVGAGTTFFVDLPAAN
jgi:PAS domain S-box-containing protein